MKIRSILFIVAAIVMLHACKKNKTTTPTPNLNPYDAKYRMEGTLTDHKDPAFVWPGNTYEYTLETTSATQVKVICTKLAMPGHMLKNGINETFYGNFGLIINFDAATNKISSITNSYGQPSPTSGRSAILDPSGVNSWDPVTKNIKMKYWMDETGFIGHRTSFDETLVYIGPR